MRLFFLPILFAAGCTPVGQEGAETPSGDSATEPAATQFATQIDPPSPDYEHMVVVRPPVNENADLRRPATAPLPANARSIGEEWIARLQARNAVGGWGLAGKGPDGPVTSIDTLFTPPEFDAWVAENGWTVPDWIGWSFVPRLSAPPVSQAAAPRIRYWPANTARTGAQNEAALSGQVLVRDGCFYLRRHDGSEALAWFLAETGLDVDDEGYLVLVDRVTGETRARVGETMTWAGPNADPKPEQTRALRAACGEHEVAEVGNPEANERMYVRYPHLRSPVNPPPPGG